MALELKHILIGLLLIITVSYALLSAVIEINNEYKMPDYDSQTELQQIQYGDDVNTISQMSLEQMQNSTQVNTASSSTGSTSGFDSLGALFKSAFASGTQTVETIAKGQPLISDMGEKIHAPAIFISLAIGILSIIILFALIKLLTGRLIL